VGHFFETLCSLYLTTKPLKIVTHYMAIVIREMGRHSVFRSWF